MVLAPDKQRQKQIPYGDDNKNATAKAKATAKTNAGVLRLRNSQSEGVPSLRMTNRPGTD
jgi:hypothetical protein